MELDWVEFWFGLRDNQCIVVESEGRFAPGEEGGRMVAWDEGLSNDIGEVCEGRGGCGGEESMASDRSVQRAETWLQVNKAQPGQ